MSLKALSVVREGDFVIERKEKRIGCRSCAALCGFAAELRVKSVEWRVKSGDVKM